MLRDPSPFRRQKAGLQGLQRILNLLIGGWVGTAAGEVGCHAVNANLQERRRRALQHASVAWWPSSLHAIPAPHRYSTA